MLLAASLLLLSACGGGSDDGSVASTATTSAQAEASSPAGGDSQTPAVTTTTATAGGVEPAAAATEAEGSSGTTVALPEVTEVAPHLAFFGDLAAVLDPPVTATFDSSADSFVLADGAVIEVPSGAFAVATELTVVVVDLRLENYLTRAPEARIYVLSTEGELDLGSPLVLDVPKPSESVTVAQFVDGEWLPIAVPAGETTRIQIKHFSGVSIGVYDKLFDDIGQVQLPSAQGDVEATLLSSCIGALLFLKAKDEENFNRVADVCTRALVNHLTPGGEQVDVRCVGDEIGPGITVQSAIAACLARAASASSEPAPVASNDGDPYPVPDSGDPYED